jgi:nicotinamide-nucleotide amidase
MTEQPQFASRLLERAKQLGVQISVAESLTGGALASALVDVSGASAVFKLGVVAYSNEVKHSVLGVSNRLLEQHGAVSDEVARSMADGALGLLRDAHEPSATASAAAQPFAGLSIATTGVAGPDWQDALPPGTVFIAVATDLEGHHSVFSRRLELTGDRDAIRRSTVDAALELALQSLQ